MPERLVIYHSPCADGHTAAWVVHSKYPYSQFYPTKHGDPAPEVTGRDVIIIDFAYDRATLIGMKDRAKSLIVLDHHKTAQKDLEGLDFCIFDMKRSGAGLAWDWFYGTARPWIIDYIEDRDLWNWKMPQAKEVCAALDMAELTFDEWYKLAHQDPKDLAIQGKSILQYQNKVMKSLAQHVREAEFAGYRVPTVNSPVLQSDLGSALAEGQPFAVIWRQAGDGRYIYSLRSTPAGVDVSEIAKTFGGGGHRQAAGFEADRLLF
jgi:uncharacterized protein